MPNWLKKIRLALGRFIVQRIGGLDLAKMNPAPTLFNALTKVFQRALVDEIPLQSALLGPLSFQVVRTSVEVGLIKLLDEQPGLRLQTIAEKLQLTEYAVHVLLMGLGSLKLVIRIGEKYHADPFLSQMLLNRVNGGFGPKYLAFAHHLLAPAMTQLEASVRSGEPRGLKHLFGGQATNFYAELADNDSLNSYFEPVMQHLSSVNEGRVASMRSWADCERVLDVGGGSGGLAMAITRYHPCLTAAVFDFPGVAAATAKTFASVPEAARLGTIGGDLGRDDLPDGYDCIVFSHFLDIFSGRDVLSYLNRAYDALPDGGKICIFTPVVNDDETGPATNALLCSYFLCLANGQGRFYSASNLISFVRAAGFVDISLTEMPVSEVVIFAVKRRG